jgi:hypothetical protein
MYSSNKSEKKKQTVWFEGRGREAGELKIVIKEREFQLLQF